VLVRFAKEDVAVRGREVRHLNLDREFGHGSRPHFR
jgi:hypothetical protein